MKGCWEMMIWEQREKIKIVKRGGREGGSNGLRNKKRETSVEATKTRELCTVRITKGNRVPLV